MDRTQNSTRILSFPQNAFDGASALAKTHLGVFLACMLFAGVVSAGAAPTLLVEFIQEVGTVEVGEPLPATVPFDFDAGESLPPQYLSWREEYGPSDIGMNFIAPLEVIDGAGRALASRTTYYLLETGPANISDLLRLNSGMIFVDDVSRYNFTSVEGVIDQLVITRSQGEFYFLEAAERIRFWAS